MNNKISILLVKFLCLYGCNSHYDYKEIEKNEVIENKSTLIKNTNTYKIFNICKDYGAPLNENCFLVIQKGNNYFKINPQYRYALSKDSIYLFKTISLDYSENGNWVFIERKYINGKENISFKLDTLPPVNSNINDKGVFYFKNGKLTRIGDLTDYKSLHDLSDNGLYYLSSPGLFYEKAIIIKEIK